jgi:hypothetical protein
LTIFRNFGGQLFRSFKLVPREAGAADDRSRGAVEKSPVLPPQQEITFLAFQIVLEIRPFVRVVYFLAIFADGGIDEDVKAWPTKKAVTHQWMLMSLCFQAHLPIAEVAKEKPFTSVRDG